MRILAIVGIGLALVLAAGGIAFLVVGAERFWRVFGDPDLGGVSFETLERRPSPNDALACPPDLCTGDTDLVPPVFAIPARELRIAFAKAIASEPRLRLVEADDERLIDRYVQRSAWLGFPDTIVVRFLDRPNGRSTLALYSRSQLGRSDLGANRGRIERWLAKLAVHADPVD